MLQNLQPRMIYQKIICRFKLPIKMKKQNKLNTRVVRKFGNEQVGKHEVGLSGAVAQLHNKITDKDGSYYAAGLHSISNYQRWNLLITDQIQPYVFEQDF